MSKKVYSIIRLMNVNLVYCKRLEKCSLCNSHVCKLKMIYFNLKNLVLDILKDKDTDVKRFDSHIQNFCLKMERKD